MTDSIYKVEPTPECPNGTRGRIAVMEVIEMNDELEHVILTNPVDEEIIKVARKQGMLTMKEDAIIKSSNGIIPFEEVSALGGVAGMEEEDEDHEPPSKETKTIEV
jgi:type IV pilus assembly protein PilB